MAEERTPISRFGEWWAGFRRDPIGHLPDDWRFTATLWGVALIVAPILIVFAFSPAGLALTMWLHG